MSMLSYIGFAIWTVLMLAIGAFTMTYASIEVLKKNPEFYLKKISNKDIDNYRER